MVSIKFLEQCGWERTDYGEFKKYGFYLWIHDSKIDPRYSFISITNGSAIFENTYWRHDIYDDGNFDCILEFLKDPEPSKEKLDVIVERIYVMDRLDRMES